MTKQLQAHYNTQMADLTTREEKIFIEIAIQ